MHQWAADVRRTRRFVDRLIGDMSEEEIKWQAGPGVHSKGCQRGAPRSDAMTALKTEAST